MIKKIFTASYLAFLFLFAHNQCLASEGFLMWLCYGSLDQIDQGEIVIQPKKLIPQQVVSEYNSQTSDIDLNTSSVRTVDIEEFLKTSNTPPPSEHSSLDINLSSLSKPKF